MFSCLYTVHYGICSSVCCAGFASESFFIFFDFTPIQFIICPWSLHIIVAVFCLLHFFQRYENHHYIWKLLSFSCWKFETMAKINLLRICSLPASFYAYIDNFHRCSASQLMWYKAQMVWYISSKCILSLQGPPRLWSLQTSMQGVPFDEMDSLQAPSW